MQILSDGQSHKIIPVSKTNLVDAVFNGLEIKSLHAPNLLEFVVNHHSVWIVCHTELLCEVVLFSLLGDEEGDWLLDVLQGESLDLGVSVAGLTTVEEDDYAGVLGSLAKSLVCLLVQNCNISLGSLLG